MGALFLRVPHPRQLPDGYIARFRFGGELVVGICRTTRGGYRREPTREIRTALLINHLKRYGTGPPVRATKLGCLPMCPMRPQPYSAWGGRRAPAAAVLTTAAEALPLLADILEQLYITYD